MKKMLMRPGRLLPMARHLLRWHYRYYLRKKSFPLVCGVYVTNRCNLQCEMCSIWSDKNRSTLTLDQVKTLVDAVTPGLCYLSFSGGEPLLVDSLMDMMAYASARVPYVHLVTNGLLLDDSRIRELDRAGLSEISISLDGDRDWHNTLRHSPKSFDAALNAIESVRRAAPRLNIVVNTVVFPDRPEQAARAVEITKALGVAHKVQAVNRHFTFKDSAAGPYKIDFEGYDREALNRLVQSLKRNPRIMNSRLYLDKIPEYFSRKLQCPMIRKGCLMPHIFLEASSYGRVSPCLYATGWEGTLEIDAGLKANLDGAQNRGDKARLERCRLCNETLYVCYWEPMISFPLGHLLQYQLLHIS